jgi:hypothetical protein
MHESPPTPAELRAASTGYRELAGRFAALAASLRDQATSETAMHTFDPTVAAQLRAVQLHWAGRLRGHGAVAAATAETLAVAAERESRRDRAQAPPADPDALAG